MPVDLFWQGVGTLAAILTSTSFIPQIIRGFRRKSLGDLSWGLLITFGIGVFFWLLYGFYRKDMIIIAANAFTLSNIVVLIAQKAFYPDAAP